MVGPWSTVKKVRFPLFDQNAQPYDRDSVKIVCYKVIMLVAEFWHYVKAYASPGRKRIYGQALQIFLELAYL